SLDDRANPGEQTYVGYEMWVRGLETRVFGIVGASGCLYAIRKDLHMRSLPEALSRDFAAALAARECGLRAVSVPQALCFVPRSASLRQEYWRKLRTVTRGLTTLWYKRSLLNPARYGLFAWLLFSHKVCRCLTPLAPVPPHAAPGAPPGPGRPLSLSRQPPRCRRLVRDRPAPYSQAGAPHAGFGAFGKTKPYARGAAPCT